MRIIVGCGNKLRGEDAFGIDVINKLKKYSPKNTKLISTFQLTPEICLELLEAKELIFIDASYSGFHQYTFACPIKRKNITSSVFSHQLCPHTVVTLLKELYNHHPEYKVYSMMTDSFEEVWDKNQYKICIDKLAKHLTSKV